MSFTSNLTNTRKEELLASRSGSCFLSTLIVDVRDCDFEGGNIACAINYPSKSFNAHEGVREDLARKVIDGEVRKVVFHCMHSRERGPACARAFEITLKRVLATHFPDFLEKTIEVSVLSGGYHSFSSAYLTVHPDIFANTYN